MAAHQQRKGIGLAINGAGSIPGQGAAA